MSRYAGERPQQSTRDRRPDTGAVTGSRYLALADKSVKIETLNSLLEEYRRPDKKSPWVAIGQRALHHAALCMEIAQAQKKPAKSAQLLDEATRQLKLVHSKAEESGTNAVEQRVRAGISLSFMDATRKVLVEHEQPDAADKESIWQNLLGIVTDPQTQELIARYPLDKHRSIAEDTWQQVAVHLSLMRYTRRLDEPSLIHTWPAHLRYQRPFRRDTPEAQLRYWNIGYSGEEFMGRRPRRAYARGYAKNTIPLAPGIADACITAHPRHDTTNNLLSRLVFEQEQLRRNKEQELQGAEAGELRLTQYRLDVVGMRMFGQLGWEFAEDEKRRYFDERSFNSRITENNTWSLEGLPPRPLEHMSGFAK